MDKTDLLRKVKALAENGVGGEKENAKAILSKLLDKYGESYDSIRSNEITPHEFKMSGKPFGKLLFNQVAYMVLGKRFRPYCYGKEGLRRVGRFLDCTDDEAIEIEAAYEFYLYHLQIDLKTFYDAFLLKNDIYPDAGNTITDAQIPDLDYADKIIRMTHGLERHDRHIGIERM